ncbi:MAG: hypothetical protein RMK29_18125 [Myxococcales bacterium]|nr:hypothetical protein [Myxococcota bacterium]MDW8283629.1 hypothetical protein [Myxococcales bacterium]
MTQRSPAGWIAPPLALLLVALAPGATLALDYNFAGSVSLNYRLLVNRLSEPREQRSVMLPGFNINASVKAVVDVSPWLSATTKVCYGCHGLEAINMVAELTPHPAFNIRAGRFQPAFGDFYLRHDPTAHKTPGNPLPYDMGHMVHGREWGYGIVPVPYVDNGAEVYGTLRPTNTVSLAYAVHIVGGFKSPEQTSPNTVVQDFALRRSRFVTSTDYLVDNNRWPGIGGRLALTFARSADMSPAVPDITVGGSFMYSRYDDMDQLGYFIYGVDMYLHLWRVNLRAEVLRRQLDIDARLLDYPEGRSTGLRMMLDPVTVSKEGFYVESDFPLGNYLEGVLRIDGMRRTGPRPARANPDEAMLPPQQRTYRPPPAAALDFDDWVMRYTVGLNIIPLTGAKLKLSYEHWRFSSLPDDSYRRDQGNFHDREYMIHLALVTSF